MTHVQTTLDSLADVQAEDIVTRNRPWELEVVSGVGKA